MTDYFSVRFPLYPIVSILAACLTLVGGLLLAKSPVGMVFLLGVFFLFCIFGYLRTCLRILPFLLCYLVLLDCIFYLASNGNYVFVRQMTVRLAAVVISIIPGLALPPVQLTRCLTGLRCPRLVTLGMLITLSFIPVLSSETRQIRSAMRTRGVVSLLHPTVFYRAFFIPLIIRLINISDTLALSVETRGFVAENVDFSVYHPVFLTRRDIFFSTLYVFLWLGCGLCMLLGVFP